MRLTEITSGNDSRMMPNAAVLDAAGASTGQLIWSMPGLVGLAWPRTCVAQCSPPCPMPVTCCYVTVHRPHIVHPRGYMRCPTRQHHIRASEALGPTFMPAHARPPCMCSMLRIADMKARQVIHPSVRITMYTWGKGRRTAEGEHIATHVADLPVGVWRGCSPPGWGVASLRRTPYMFFDSG